MWKNVEECGKKDKILTKQNQNNLSFLDSRVENVCKFCSKKFSRSDSLQRHISVCKLNFDQKKILENPRNSKNVEKKINIKCHYCKKCFSSQSNVTRHEKKCFEKERQIWEIKEKYAQELREKELKIQNQDIQNLVLQKELEKEKAVNQEKERTIEIAKKSKQVINNINTTNKTINYLNNTYGDMIAMEQFLYNLEHTEQLTQEEREKLLISFKDSGIELFARSFSHIMKENCRRQLLKEGLPDMGLIPLYCSDGNLRSHKEKGDQGWNTKYDDHSLNKMINISSNQVFQSYRKPLVIFGKDRNKVFKQLKQDNHSKNEKKKEIDNE